MSETITVLIVEDEFLTADAIKENLESMGYRVVGIARDANDALKILDKKETDIAILDMNIQGSRDGIWLARTINDIYKIPFIFLTAYSDTRTVKSAIETKPFGYLVKPFNKMDIYTAIEVALQNYNEIQKQQGLQIGSTLKEKSLHMDDYLFVKDKTGYSKVGIKNILYVKSELKYVEIHTVKKKYVLRYSLAELLEIMPNDHFIQVHKSYIVNKNVVDHIGINYLLINGHEIPYSSQRKEELLKAFNFL